MASTLTNLASDYPAQIACFVDGDKSKDGARALNAAAITIIPEEVEQTTQVHPKILGKPEQKLLCLLRLQWLNRYGDLLPRHCTALRKRLDILHQQKCSEYWAPKAEDLRWERELLKCEVANRAVRGWQLEISAHRELWKACERVGVTHEKGENLLREFEEDGIEIGVASLCSKIRQGRYADVAEMLYRDLRMVPLLLELGHAEVEDMQNALRIMVEVWFDVPQGKEDKPREWTATGAILLRREGIGSIWSFSLQAREIIADMKDFVSKNLARQPREYDDDHDDDCWEI